MQVYLFVKPATAARIARTVARIECGHSCANVTFLASATVLASKRQKLISVALVVAGRAVRKPCNDRMNDASACSFYRMCRVTLNPNRQRRGVGNHRVRQVVGV